MPIKIQPNWEFIEMLLGVVWWIEFYVKIWCDNLLLNDVKYEFYILSLLNSNSSQRPLIHRHVCMEYYVHSMFFFKTQRLIKTQHIFIGWWREPAPTQICYTLNLPLILSLPLPLPLPPSLSLSLSLTHTHTHTHKHTHLCNYFQQHSRLFDWLEPVLFSLFRQRRFPRKHVFVWFKSYIFFFLKPYLLKKMIIHWFLSNQLAMPRTFKFPNKWINSKIDKIRPL